MAWSSAVLLTCFFCAASCSAAFSDRGWSPDGSGTGATLFDIEGTAPDNGFIAAANGVLLHNSGAGWYAMSHPLPGDVKTVYAFSTVSAFAGGYDHISTEWGFAKYDGVDWDLVQLGAGDVIYDIWGPNPGEVYVTFKSGKVIRYDGGWNVIFDAPQDIYAAWGMSSQDMFICGSNGYIAHYDGFSWTEMVTGTTQAVYCIWGASSNCVYATGSNGTALFYNGIQWSSIGLGSSYNMWDVEGSACNDVYISSGHGDVHHYDGSNWNAMNVGADVTLFCCWQAAQDIAYAGGAGGHLFRYDNQPVPTVTPPPPTFTPTPTPTFTPTSRTPTWTPTITPTPTITATPPVTPTRTSTPTMPPTATPTRTPWPTSTFPPSPTPSPTADQTQNPNHSPTPEPPTPSSTPAPCSQTGVEVIMPSHHFAGGDPCGCRVRICNAEGRRLEKIPLFVVLDAYGTYFFAPSLTENFDHYLPEYPSFEVGLTEVIVLPEFEWPHNSGNAENIYWYGALVNEEMTNIIGKMGVFTFGWSP